VPGATGGLLYELDPATGTVAARPVLGAKAQIVTTSSITPRGPADGIAGVHEWR
jgi:hypothetical protein